MPTPAKHVRLRGAAIAWILLTKTRVTDKKMKTFLQNLSGPKIVFAAVVLALALVVLMMMIAGADPTGVHGHSHD